MLFPQLHRAPRGSCNPPGTIWELPASLPGACPSLQGSVSISRSLRHHPPPPRRPHHRHQGDQACQWLQPRVERALPLQHPCWGHPAAGPGPGVHCHAGEEVTTAEEVTAAGEVTWLTRAPAPSGLSPRRSWFWGGTAPVGRRKGHQPCPCALCCPRLGSAPAAPCWAVSRWGQGCHTGGTCAARHRWSRSAGTASSPPCPGPDPAPAQE